MTNSLKSLRAEIAQLQERRDSLKHASPSRDEIKSRLTPHLKAESDALRRSAGNALLGDDISPLRLRVSPAGFVDLVPVLSLLLGVPAVAKALVSCLDGYVDDNAPSASDRLAELADIAERLDGLELAEEAEVCRLELIGQQAPRRANARPEIVLAVVDDQGKVL